MCSGCMVMVLVVGYVGEASGMDDDDSSRCWHI